MKSLFVAIVVVLALASSAFAGHCGVQQQQQVRVVQRVVVQPQYAQQIQFVEVQPHYVQQQVKFVEPVRVVERVKVVKAEVEKQSAVRAVRGGRSSSFKIERSVNR